MADYSSYGGRPLSLIQQDTQSGTTREVTVGGYDLPVTRIIRRQGKRRHVQYTSTGLVYQPLGPIAPSITISGELSAEAHQRFAGQLTILEDMEQASLPVTIQATFFTGSPFSTGRFAGLVSTGRFADLGTVSNDQNKSVLELGTWEIDSLDIDEGDWFIGRALKTRWTIRLVKID